MPAGKYFFGTNSDDRGGAALHGTANANFVDHIHGLDGSFDIVTDAPAGASSHDFIGDFSRSQSDKIDLSAVDTNSGDAKFDFIGSSSFYEAGQVRFLKDGGSTIVQVNTDSDAQAEMDIDLTGSFNLSASDFVL